MLISKSWAKAVISADPSQIPFAYISNTKQQNRESLTNNLDLECYGQNPAHTWLREIHSYSELLRLLKLSFEALNIRFSCMVSKGVLVTFSWAERYVLLLMYELTSKFPYVLVAIGIVCKFIRYISGKRREVVLVGHLPTDLDNLKTKMLLEQTVAFTTTVMQMNWWIIAQKVQLIHPPWWSQWRIKES